jgi:anti-sigma factor RsiW
MNIDTRHLSDERLLLLVDGELAPRLAAAALRHLRSCEACRVQAERIEASAAAFGRAYHRAHATRDGAGGPASRSRQALKTQLDELGGHRRRGPSWVTAGALLLAALVGLEFLSIRSGPAGAGERHPEVRPIPYLTPGATRPVAVAELCSPRRIEARAVPAHVRQAVVRDYSMELVSAGEYELDYLITPELGGSDDRRNLWPERYSSQSWNAKVKDQLEDLLSRLVCAGTVPLAAAQRDMATDWIGAYKKYFRTDRPLAYAEPGPIDPRAFDLPMPRYRER